MSAKKTKSKSQGAGPFEALRALKEELARESAKAAPPPGKRPSPPRPLPPPTTVPTAPEPGGDAMLFHRLFAGVTPLDRSRGARIPMQPTDVGVADRAAQRGAAEARSDADAVHEHLRILVEGQARFEVSDDGIRVEGRRLDVPLDALRHLRRGRLPIDARMDMHGLSAHEARAKLDVFLRAMRTRGERCVLVIHGKGDHSPGGAGILRGEMAAWLSQGAASEHIAAFATAQTSDGGEGAVYVLLRR